MIYILIAIFIASVSNDFEEANKYNITKYFKKR